MWLGLHPYFTLMRVWRMELRTEVALVQFRSPTCSVPSWDPSCLHGHLGEHSALSASLPLVCTLYICHVLYSSHLWIKATRGCHPCQLALEKWQLEVTPSVIFTWITSNSGVSVSEKKSLLGLISDRSLLVAATPAEAAVRVASPWGPAEQSSWGRHRAVLYWSWDSVSTA